MKPRRASGPSGRSKPIDHGEARETEGLLLEAMSRTVHVPYTLEQDEDGVWCAHAQLRPGVGAHGEGDTDQAAIEDLRAALSGLIAEFGPPQELTLDVDVA